MYLTNDNLVLRNADINDVQILCNWWSDGKVMAHAGFPNGVHTDADKLMDKIKNGTDFSRTLQNQLGVLQSSIDYELNKEDFFNN